MRIRKLMQAAILAGVVLTGSAVHAENYSNRDFKQREKLERRVEADQRAVDKERRELSRAGRSSYNHERRELTNAERRLERDQAELRELDRRMNRQGYRSYR